MTVDAEVPAAQSLGRRELLTMTAAAGALLGAGGLGAVNAAAQVPAAASGKAPLKIGIMGTGMIPQSAVIDPAKSVPDVTVDAVGSRTPERGREYADKHGIPRVLDYEALISDPAIDIIYIALPISLHAEWTMKALAAGKHVLCEKSMTANAAEAVRVADAVRKSKRVFMEAYAYPYHPFAKRVREIIDMGAIGALQSVDSTLDMARRAPAAVPAGSTPPAPRPSIRRQFSTAGGGLLDAGCYPVKILCDYLGPVERVVEAAAELDTADPQIDMAMGATLQFAGGRRGRMHTSFQADKTSRQTIFRGTTGTLTVEGLNQPQQGGELRLEWAGGTYVEKAEAVPSYVYQLREMVRCVRDGAPVMTSADHGLVVMRAMDAIYQKAGLKLRGAA